MGTKLHSQGTDAMHAQDQPTAERVSMDNTNCCTLECSLGMFSSQRDRQYAADSWVARVVH